MPKSESSRLEALEQLLAERRKHEGYLAKLEERRAATPEHVFTRLRTEYLTKLTDLQVRAAAEAEGLAAGIEEDRTAVVAIEERLATVHEERLEGELRAEVGEYDPKDWTKKLTVLNATIAQLEKERETKAGAWERTQRLVNEARAGIAGVAAPATLETGMSAEAVRELASAPAPAAALEARTSASEHPASAAAPAPPAAPATAPAAAPARKPTEIAGAPSFDELAFLNSVVGRVSTPVPIPQPAPVPRPSRPVPVEAEPASAPSVAPRAPTPVRPPAEAVASAAAPVAAPVAPAPSAVPEPPAALAPTPVRPGPAVAAPAAESPSAPAAVPAPPREDEPPGPLGRPTPRTSQAIKTLKCQECGTFNYPTEWYCERCGGELAAL